MFPATLPRLHVAKTALIAALILGFCASLLRATQTSGDVRIYEFKGQPIEIILKDGSKPPLRVGESVPHDLSLIHI